MWSKETLRGLKQHQRVGLKGREGDLGKGKGKERPFRRVTHSTTHPSPKTPKTPNPFPLICRLPSLLCFSFCCLLRSISHFHSSFLASIAHPQTLQVSIVLSRQHSFSYSFLRCPTFFVTIFVNAFGHYFITIGMIFASSSSRLRFPSHPNTIHT